MRRLLAIAIATLLGVTLGVSLGGAPAQAQTKTRRDATGEVGRTWDLRSVKVQNNVRRLALTVRVGDVQRRRTSVTTSVLPGSFFRAGQDDTVTYLNLHTLATAGGRWTTTLSRYTQDGTGPDAELVADDPVACAGMRTAVRTGRHGFIRVVVPQRCLGAEAGRLRIEPWVYDSVVTREADGMRVPTAARRGDVPDDQQFDALTSGGVTTRRGR